MKTQKHSFEELRMRATKGPYKTAKPEHHDYTPIPIVSADLFRIAWVNHYATSFDDEKALVNAEAITRLLNAFVAGDGLNTLRDVAESLAWTLMVMKDIPETSTFCDSVRNLRTLIAQLDGEDGK